MGKRLLITGAGRGIGAATARLAATRGYRVMVNYHRDPRSAEQLVQAIRAGGGEAVAWQADVADERSVGAMFAELDRHWGGLDALVNNAGMLEQQCRLGQIDGARLQRVFATNVFGSFFCARQAVQRMSTALGGDGGAIVNLSSIAASLGAPGEYLDYAAAKGAIDSFTRGLAKEVAAEGIRVNAVRPGVIDTGIHASGGEPGRVARVAPSVPLQRGGTAEEVAQAVLWLLSDEASYCTGALLDVSGGR
ncbi:SDR family oxidoreductase [Aestuariirhabdus litorea]|uniref:SDR family oxidoreductase n=1 Tax=Aestuariirhabdus litorea TaxID=2528527 RepID=A0A3P3VPR0_9GAMM|nr:SDR family oxidoreductase [Aestuariirhabdus litorea]RRJ83646.1 SDR family oxidoreductase [Aestuariirhabdus litorea]RWW96868.1 SDR family oxidoreductase [Endozoicomonadaceae bacterium GTF-13]